MTPTQDLNHAAEGAALLTEHYKRAPVIKGILAAFLARIQAKENDLFALLNAIVLANHPLPGGPWQILDQLGAIVGVKREGRTDTAYLAAIKVQIRINNSHGLAEDIIQVTALLVAGAIYREWYPAAFEVQAFDITTEEAQALVDFLGDARSAGTEGFIRYTTWTAPTGVIIFGSNVGTIANAAGFMDSVSSEFPNAFTSMQPL